MRKDRWAWVAIAVIAVVALGQIAFFFPRTVDDMFIFLRYAENAANGDGLVFNLGERVEGFSSVTWTLLLTVGALVGANLVTWSKLLAVASIGALLVGSYRLAQERLGVGEGAAPGSARRYLAYLAPLFTASCTYVMAWALLGLETPLYLALLVWSAVTLGRYVDAPSRGRLIAAGLVGGAFGLSRPEAPMMLAAIAGGLAIAGGTPGLSRLAGLRVRVPRVVIAALPAALTYLAYAVFRRLYFGLWWPHTYYSKKGQGWHTAGLRQLTGEGASPAEVILVVGGVALALWAAWKRRDAIMLALAAATIVFVAKVEIDWMPNVRYWLPLWIALPGVWLWAADALWRRAQAATTAEARAWPWWLGGAAAALVVVATLAHQVRIDMRYSIFSYRARGSKLWVKPKTLALWEEAWACLTHTPPAAIAKEDRFHMGMITQVYRLLESDARPLAETWFIGPDIGLVGYLTPVNVWEPPGLFTPDVRLLGEDLKRTGKLPPALLDAATRRPIAMTELFDGRWTEAMKKHPVLSQRLEPTGGWSYVRERGAPKPSHAEIVARYEAALARLPSSYYLMYLHGGALGAQLERRTRIVREQP